MSQHNSLRLIFPSLVKFLRNGNRIIGEIGYVVPALARPGFTSKSELTFRCEKKRYNESSLADVSRRSCMEYLPLHSVILRSDDGGSWSHGTKMAPCVSPS